MVVYMAAPKRSKGQESETQQARDLRRWSRRKETLAKYRNQDDPNSNTAQ